MPIQQQRCCWQLTIAVGDHWWKVLKRPQKVIRGSSCLDTRQMCLSRQTDLQLHSQVGTPGLFHVIFSVYIFQRFLKAAFLQGGAAGSFGDLTGLSRSPEQPPLNGILAGTWGWRGTVQSLRGSWEYGRAPSHSRMRGGGAKKEWVQSPACSSGKMKF